MDRIPPARAATRTLAQHLDSHDLRAHVVEALAATPMDEAALRASIWTYVRAERSVGVAPALVMSALGHMVDEALPADPDARAARGRDVIRWGVEAYLGRLGGDALGPRDETPADALPAAALDDAPAGPHESAFDDWRARLTRNLSRRTDGKWEPLTYLRDAADPE